MWKLLISLSAASLSTTQLMWAAVAVANRVTGCDILAEQAGVNRVADVNIADLEEAIAEAMVPVAECGLRLSKL